MQSVSSMIWTRIAVSISYDDNHYTTGTSEFHISLIPTRKVCIQLLSLQLLVNSKKKSLDSLTSQENGRLNSNLFKLHLKTEFVPHADQAEGLDY